LYRLGHRRVDCLNTQNRNPEIDRRIDIWERWRRRRRIEGRLWDDPAEVFTDPTVRAYGLMKRLLADGALAATALVGTTCPAAIGAIRACWEHDVQVGQELSICSVNIEPPAEFFCPSITGLSTPGIAEVLDQCCEWFLRRRPLGDRLLLEPSQSVLFKGESTGRHS
jgi:DNA-binding LacI/PurR family transcriptional regulator